MTDGRVLSTRELNRALLARQHMLERAAVPPSAVIEHLVGMQAQVPANPYVGLWSRVAAFDPEQTSQGIEERKVVRMLLMRGTIHLVTAADALRIRPVVQPVLERTYRSTPFARKIADLELAEVADVGRALLDERPLSTADLGRELAIRWPGHDPASLAHAVRYFVPLVQVPPRGLWQRAGQPRWQTLGSWLGRPVEAEATPDHLVERYLRIFGPASARDVATWSWLTGIRAVLERLRPRLRLFRDERGTELWDVADGLLPDPATPAAPRLLPEYDNIALSHADRARIIAPTAMGRLTGFVGTLLIDGFVNGQWRLDERRDDAALVLDPFEPLPPRSRDELVAEAERFVRFAAPAASRHAVEFGTAREASLSAATPARGQWAPR